MSLLYAFGKKPIIAAVRKPCDVNLALESHVDNLFFMGGTVKDIIEAVRMTKDAKKGAFIHVDLIRGLSNTDKETVDFIAEYVRADGIVTPKVHLIKEAKRAGLYGILHLFILDSLALVNGLRLAQNIDADAIELMPGAIPKIIQEFANVLEDIPIIASGLIQSKEEVMESLDAGATSLSVSSTDLWNMQFQEL